MNQNKLDDRNWYKYHDLLDLVREYAPLFIMSQFGGCKRLEDKIVSYVARAEKRGREEGERLKKLLSVAKCPECDGSGSILQQVGDDEWEQQQCQWCYEKNQLTNKDNEQN